MNSQGDNYSRFITLTKVILPLVALGILSTLFLLSKSVDPDQSVPYADVDVNELASQQRIGAPNYAGVTKDGEAISIRAKSISPDAQNPRKIHAVGLDTKLEDPAGRLIKLTANKGLIDTEQQQLTLNEGVRISTSTGYLINTSGVLMALDKTGFITEGEISAKGPLGHLTAGQMQLKAGQGETDANLLVFNNGVKLIYDPKSGAPEPKRN